MEHLSKATENNPTDTNTGAILFVLLLSDFSAESNILLMGDSPIMTLVQQGDTAVISISHAIISIDQAESLGDEFKRTISALPTSTTTVHLDVTKVVGMSSRGFEALLALRRSCESRNLKLTVSQLQPTFHRLLARMGFLRLLGIDE